MSPRPARIASAAALGALLAVAMATVGYIARPPIPRAAGPMTRQVYVWQRAWDARVVAAVRDHGGTFERVVPLAAEIEWGRGAGAARTVVAPVDFAAVARSCGSVGAALRVGPYPGPFERDDEAARRVVDGARSIVARAADAGVTLAELQIDFDAASSKLRGYRVWVEAVKRAVAPVPVTVTTLPTWLGHSGFGALVDAADGFVLQVHSVNRPRSPEEPITLCDPAAARAWAERAARYGRPFRVALPTYGYVVAFDGAGEFIGLSAGGATAGWPAGTVLRRVDADAGALARLVAGWAADRPMGMEGIIWYRMPVDGEPLNWRWPTLARVADGVVPAARLVAEARRVEPGLIEIDLVNRGAADAPAMQRVRVEWTGARLLASDGASGYRIERAGADAATIEPADGTLTLRRIGPGERVTCAWIRFDRDTEVTPHVQPVQPVRPAQPTADPD